MMLHIAFVFVTGLAYWLKENSPFAEPTQFSDW